MSALLCVGCSKDDDTVTRCLILGDAPLCPSCREKWIDAYGLRASIDAQRKLFGDGKWLEIFGERDGKH